MTEKVSTAAAGGRQCAPLQAPIDPELLGVARVVPSTPVEAGSWQTFVVNYTVGHYGIDDSGALRICFRFAADHTKPQLNDPLAPGYTVVKASNNAVLECRFEQKGNVRPFDQTLYVKVVNGYLREGDTISATFGETGGGSPGMRVQTFVEDDFEFRVLVDPIATFNFQSLPHQPTVQIVPGPPVRYVLVTPTLRRTGEPFAIGIKGEDVWGNPSDQCRQILRILADHPVEGLPDRVELEPGTKSVRLEAISVRQAGPVAIWLVDEGGAVVARQLMTIVDETAMQPFWADFHGQSEETIGTNSVESYFAFARDQAFLDIAAHQGNDFQITNRFWAELNALTKRLNDPGRFVTLPGYEWSGNTPLGGDRNVFFTTEGRPIRRSSHALLDDKSDIELDAPTAGDLFGALRDVNEDAICFAHCGGRYADISVAHDGRIETAVEVHSAWGTFEWLLHDALEIGHRVGVVCNSDGHKGRPGASYPGASSFGAIGGLTCMLIPELTREAVVEGLRRRHHYGTTGGPNGRMHLEVHALLEARLCDNDPKLGPYRTTPAERLMMGDIGETEASAADIDISVAASIGVERIDLFNGTDLVHTARNYSRTELGSRFRVLMEGAAYRGRFRQVTWDGTAKFTGGTIGNAQGINFFNPDRVLDHGTNTVSWSLVTTGNLAGFDVWLQDADQARIAIETPLVSCEVELASLGLEERIFEVEGVLPRSLRLFRLPDEPLPAVFSLKRRLELNEGTDNAFYARVTLEDGTQAWSSPIYLVRA